MPKWLSRWQRPLFQHPIPSAPRTAILLPLFRTNRRSVPFRPEDRHALERWAPECVAGRVEQLRLIRYRPSRAIVVLSMRGESLEAADRQDLWRHFEVPVFEQIIEADGTLIASECEGHEALHLFCPVEDAPPGEILEDRCACGEIAIRLRPQVASDEEDPDSLSVNAAAI